MAQFKTSTHGKWILCGEHAVIRGIPALVYPVKTHTLTLEFEPHKSELSASFNGFYGEDVNMLFWSVIERGLELKQASFHDLTGKFHVHNTIPIGSGLGASAALSVAITRWFHWQGLVQEKEQFSFAKQLENLFHNQSSGLDIAGCASQQGTYFLQGNTKTIEQNWQPTWYLSFSGHIGITSHCVKKVSALFDKNPIQAQRIDKKMQTSVELALQALAQSDEQTGLIELAEAINLACQCFRDWDLVDKQVDAHLNLLKNSGAIAVKPTGSGCGGYVLSLWKTPPPKELEKDLILIG